MQSSTDQKVFPNDVFVSYSRKDKDFAGRLENALEGYRPPKGLGLPLRNLVVFRDETDFTGVEYHQAIEQHIRNSKKMIVICSPQARNSLYVNDEIRRFAQERGRENIIPVLFSGIPNNEAKPGEEEEKAFPEALCKLLEMPLAVSFIGFNARKDKVNKGIFYAPWFTLLANLYNLSRDEIEEREKKRRVRIRNAWIVGVGSVIIILAAALVIALVSRKNEITARRAEAERARVALSRQAAAHSVSRFDSFLDQSLLLAAQAFAFSHTTEARSALLRGLHPTRISAFLFGHDAPVIAIAYSPDGETIASSDLKGNVFVWPKGAQSARQALPPGDSSLPSSLCFCSHGKKLAVGHKNGLVTIWDIAVSPPVLLREIHWNTDDRPEKMFVVTLRCLDEGQLIAAASLGGRVAVWEALSDKSSWETGPDTQDGSLYMSAISAEGDILLASNMGSISMWKIGRDNSLWVRDMPEVRRENEPFALRAKRALPELGFSILKEEGKPADLMPPVYVDFVSDSMLVVVSKERLRLLEREDGKDYELPEPYAERLRKINLADFTTIGRISAHFHYIPDLLIIPTNEGARRIDVRYLRDYEVKGRRTQALSSAFSPDGKHFAVGYRDGSIAVWQTRSEEPLESHVRLQNPAREKSRINLDAALFDASGKRLFFAADETLGYIDIDQDKLQPTLIDWPYTFDSVNALTLDNSGRFLGVGSEKHRLQVWDIQNKKLWREFPEDPKTSVMDIKFLDGGRRLIAGRKGTLEIWAVESRKQVFETVQAHTDWITFLEKSSDGSLLASGSEDKTVILWDARQNVLAKLKALKTRAKPIAAGFISKKLLAVGHVDGSLAIWDFDREALLWKPKLILDEPIVAVQSVKDGNELYVAGKSGEIAVVDYRTGFSRLKIAPGKLNRRFRAISSDGRWSASFDKDGWLVLLDIDPRRWAELACRRAGRSLSPEEWADFIGPEIQYDPACTDSRFAGSLEYESHLNY